MNHNRQMMGLHMEHLAYLEGHLETIEAEIDQILAPHADTTDLLCTIPGVQKDAAAAVILAEIGVGMSYFPSDQHLASWAGLCPGNNESAGKKKSSRTTKGNKSLKAVLCQAAWAASRTKGTRLSAHFHRVQKRRGRKKAIMATAHLLLRIIYHMINNNLSYQEIGGDYLQDPTKVVNFWIKRIEAQGFKVTIEQADRA